MAPSVSLCVILIEVTAESPAVPQISYKASKYVESKEEGKEPDCLQGLEFREGEKAVNRGRRLPVTLEVKTFIPKEDMDEPKPEEGEGCEGAAKGDLSQRIFEADQTEDGTKKIHFSSGNANVEVTKGIIHLYKENERTPLEGAAPSDMLVMLSIPAYIACRDLLQFLAPFSASLVSIKVIREDTPNQYIALLQCRPNTALELYNFLNGTPYSSLEEEVCKVAFVSRVESMKEDGAIGLPLVGHTELPTCPVCLERMDESVEGILTILCNHTFHSGCLAKWSDSGCPVCRYVQTPEWVAQNMCSVCGKSESLWICLICGHIGCGRYVGGHAYRHYCETSHCFAIQPSNNRVWDYAADAFVHRLLQNKDGKVVELNRRGGEEECEDPEDKFSHIQLEYTYMLASQMEQQRHYFEQKLAEQGKDFRAEVEKLQLKVAETSVKKEELEIQHHALMKEKIALEKKYNHISQKMAKVLNDLKEEKALNRHLQQDQQKWKDQIQKLETDADKYKKEIVDLKDQLRDIMFYLEAQNKIKESPMCEEIVDGKVTVDESGPSSSKGRRKKRN